MRRNGLTLAYDNNGNMTSDGTNSYTWNERNQLSGISGLVSASFVYGPFGRRQQKTINSTSTDYLHDGANPVQEPSSGTVDANMLDGLGVDEYFQRADLPRCLHGPISGLRQSPSDSRNRRYGTAHTARIRLLWLVSPAISDPVAGLGRTTAERDTLEAKAS